MALVLDGDNGIVGVLATNTDGDVIFDTNTLFVDAVENKVGIGTTAPNSNLHIKSTTDVKLTLETDEDSDCWINLSGATSEASIGYEPATNSLRFANAADGVTSNVRMTIDASGNVGIGTESPAEKLEVNGSFKIGNLKIQNANGGRIGFNRNTANGDIYDSNFAAFQINGAYSGADFMAFEAYTSGGVGTDAMAIKDNGYVGIGTTSPQRMLHIHDGSQTGLHITNTQSGAGANDGFSQYIRDDNQATELMVRENSYLGFGTNNQLKVKITNGGILEGLSDAEIKTSPIRKHSNTISTNTTIDSSENAIASGPISVATGVTLTINGNMTVV